MGIAKDIARPIYGPNFEEGRLTKKLENYTAPIPSLGYLALAAGGMALAVAFFSAKQRHFASRFSSLVAAGIPSILILGLYTKLVKIEHELIREKQTPIF